MWPLKRCDWEDLGDLWLHDADQFNFTSSGGIHKTLHKVQRCKDCGTFRYRDNSFWFDCEVVRRGNGQYELCEQGFRKGKGLKGTIAAEFSGVAALDKK